MDKDKEKLKYVSPEAVIYSQKDNLAFAFCTAGSGPVGTGDCQAGGTVEDCPAGMTPIADCLAGSILECSVGSAPDPCSGGGSAAGCAGGSYP